MCLVRSDECWSSIWLPFLILFVQDTYLWCGHPHSGWFFPPYLKHFWKLPHRQMQSISSMIPNPVKGTMKMNPQILRAGLMPWHSRPVLPRTPCQKFRDLGYVASEGNCLSISEKTLHRLLHTIFHPSVRQRVL